MIQCYRSDLKSKARELRKRMTDAEQLLWKHLRRKQANGLQFYRQKPLGNYIVDFYCPQAKLVIEIDGGQHFEERHIQKDKIRDNYLKEEGLTTLRFTSREIFKNLQGVYITILEYLET